MINLPDGFLIRLSGSGRMDLPVVLEPEVPVSEEDKASGRSPEVAAVIEVVTDKDADTPISR